MVAVFVDKSSILVWLKSLHVCAIHTTMYQYGYFTLSYNRIRPNNRVTNLYVIFSDTICDMGGTSELSNYGEYSGAPSEGQTYEYAKTLLTLMTKKVHPEGRCLCRNTATVLYIKRQIHVQSNCNIDASFQETRQSLMKNYSENYFHTFTTVMRPSVV